MWLKSIHIRRFLCYILFTINNKNVKSMTFKNVSNYVKKTVSHTEIDSSGVFSNWTVRLFTNYLLVTISMLSKFIMYDFWH